MRVDLALIVCGNGICEVITATLGPLPLDQLPKSKPVTPYAVFTDDTHWGVAATSPTTTAKSRPSYNVSPSCGIPDRERHRRAHTSGSGMKKPLRALAVAEDAPAGVVTGRVGAGLNGPGLPRDEARFSSRRLGRNPPSGRPASLSKTPYCSGTVAPRDEFP